MIHRQVPAFALRTIAEHAGRENATLHAVTEQALRKRLDRAIDEAAREQAHTPG